jgi:A/G-specific adenine glycosylase
MLRWFDGNRRDLPWRHDRDPYRIWVSEVMLQQTTVAMVRPRFEVFLQAFPNVQLLAKAHERSVLRLWEGLGYYRRAINLHRAARQLVALHGGQLRNDPVAWINLPGVGRYILGAVLSQAFDRRLPIVEANIKRVLCRLFGQRGAADFGPVNDWLWRTAEMLLPRRRVGDFNQALMELGALVCTIKEPKCGQCPLASICVARRKGLQQQLPVKLARKSIVEVDEVAVAVRKGPRVLVVQRPEVGRWANMWEFPHDALEAKETHRKAAVRLLAERLGIRADIGDEIVTMRHAVTRFRITMRCLEAVCRSGSLKLTYYRNARWLRPADLGALPFSVPQRRLAAELVSADRRIRLFG